MYPEDDPLDDLAPPLAPSGRPVSASPEPCETKTCTSCHEARPVEDFRPRHARCRPCQNDYARRWREANLERVQGYAKAQTERRRDDRKEAAEARLEAARRHISRGGMPQTVEDLAAIAERRLRAKGPR
jgi:hypothetical protein